LHSVKLYCTTFNVKKYYTIGTNYVVKLIFISVFCTSVRITCHENHSSTLIQYHTLPVFGFIAHYFNYLPEVYLRIECILLKFHWGMKALTEVHFQWSWSPWYSWNTAESGIEHYKSNQSNQISNNTDLLFVQFHIVFGDVHHVYPFSHIKHWSVILVYICSGCWNRYHKETVC
jgi:hypothetical protein